MFELELSYKQFCIFNESVKNPFNTWSDANIAQGFSIRDDSISIMTLNNDGILKIDILNDNSIKDEAKRIIEFGYKVKDDFLTIATINMEMKIQLEKGLYIIRVQLCKESEDRETCYLSFINEKNIDNLPRYLRFDEEISKTVDFELNSFPA